MCVRCARARALLCVGLLIGNHLQARNDMTHSFSRENQSERRNGGAGTSQFYSRRKFIVISPSGPVRPAAVTRTAISTPAAQTMNSTAAFSLYFFIFTPVRHHRNNNITVFSYT